MLWSAHPHHLVYVLEAFFATSHCRCWKSCVTTWTIPVWKKFGRKGNPNIEIFCDSHQQKARNPQLVADIYAGTRPNPVLPLTWHDLSIKISNFETSIVACIEVQVCNWSSKRNIRTNRAVVRTFRAWITIRRPSKRLLCEFSRLDDKCIFLVNPKHWLFCFDLRRCKNFLSKMTEIGVCRNEFFAGIILPHPGVTHYQYVVPFAKGVLEKRDWF